MYREKCDLSENSAELKLKRDHVLLMVFQDVINDDGSWVILLYNIL